MIYSCIYIFIDIFTCDSLITLFILFAMTCVMHVLKLVKKSFKTGQPAPCNPAEHPQPIARLWPSQLQLPDHRCRISVFNHRNHLLDGFHCLKYLSKVEWKLFGWIFQWMVNYPTFNHRKVLLGGKTSPSKVSILGPLQGRSTAKTQHFFSGSRCRIEISHRFLRSVQTQLLA